MTAIEDIFRLLDGIEDGTADDAEIQFLEEASMRDSQVCESLVGALQVEFALRQANRLNQSRVKMDEVERLQRVFTQVMSRVESSPRGLRNDSQRRSRRRRVVHRRRGYSSVMIVSVGVAAVFVIMLSIIWVGSRVGDSSVDEVEGVMVTLNGSVFIDGEQSLVAKVPLRVGVSYAAEQAVLTMSDQARLTLSGEIVPLRTDGSQWRLHKGMVTSEVRSRSDDQLPFVVQTSRGLVTVLGTTFTVEEAQIFSRVTVAEGRVRVTDGRGSRVLTANDSSLLAASEWSMWLFGERLGSKQPLRAIEDGDFVSLSGMSDDKFNILFACPESVDSLELDVTHEGNHKAPSSSGWERQEPFLLFGDILKRENDMKFKSLVPGVYRIVIQPYDSVGDQLPQVTFSFTVGDA